MQNNGGTHASSFNPNLQYGPSLFDRTHVFNAIFNYDLAAGSLDKDHQWLVCDRCVPREQRVAIPVVEGDFGGGPFSNSVNMIATVDPSSLGASAHSSVCGTAGLNGLTYGSAGDGPNCAPTDTGSGRNLFSDPGAASLKFRYPGVSTDGRDGSGHPVRGLGLGNLDSRLGKTTSFHERFKLEISADFFNLFNHVNFFDPALHINSPETLGVISSELIPASLDRTGFARFVLTENP